MSPVTVPTVYDQGDMISMRAQFYNINGVPADPTAVFLKVRDPLGNQANYNPVQTGVGAYNFDLLTTLTDTVGKYTYRYEGTGAVTSAEEKQFWLRESVFT